MFVNGTRLLPSYLSGTCPSLIIAEPLEDLGLATKTESHLLIHLTLQASMEVRTLVSFPMSTYPLMAMQPALLVLFPPEL